MLYSFDVFDTLITRTTGTPQGVFSLMQKELSDNEEYRDIPEYVRENFCEMRIGAEKMARYHYVRNGIEDIKFEEIYEALATVGGVTPLDVKRLMLLEMKIEMENIVPIEENIQKLVGLINKGEHVVLISDMYFDGSFIKALLLSVCSVFERIKIYVSSEYRKCKSSKSLYKLVQKEEASDYNAWIHIGDNNNADILAPRELGITAIEYSKLKLWDIEKDSLVTNDVRSQLMIGGGKNNRLKYKNMAMQIGCTVATPILYPYVNWIIKNCINNKFDRLYFIARDGYVLKKIADVIIRKLNLHIKTFYIYGSRRAWRMPAYDGSKEALRQVIAISDPSRIKSMSDLADVLQVNEEEILNYVKEFTLIKDEISYNLLCQIVNFLVENDEFRSFLVEKNLHKRQLTINYFRQEVDFRDDNFAFVELRGSGYTTRCMSELIKELYHEPINIFYYNLVSLGMIGNCNCYNYIVDHFSDGIILELLCRAPHGQTNAYETKDNMILPVLGSREGEKLISYGYLDYVAGIESCVENLVDVLRFHRLNTDYRNLAIKFIDYASNKPDKDVLKFFSDMPFYMSGDANEFYVVAPELDYNIIRQIFLFGKEEKYNGVSMKFSLMRCDKSKKKKIDFYKKYKGKLETRYNKMYNCPLGTYYTFDLVYEKFIDTYMTGKRCAIYGAGKNGKKLYYLSRLKKCNIVCWADEKYPDIKDRVPVTGTINEIKKIEIDVIVISIMDEMIRRKVKNDFLSLGISENRIKFFNSDLWYYLYLEDNLINNEVIIYGEEEFVNTIFNVARDIGYSILDTIYDEWDNCSGKCSAKHVKGKYKSGTTILIAALSVKTALEMKRNMINEGIPENGITMVVKLTEADSRYLNVW